MTSSSPFTLQYDASPPPARRYSVVGAAIAWTAILVCLGVIGVTNWRAARSAARARAIDDYQLLMTSRVVIGEWQLFSQLPAAPPGLKDQLASQLQRIASDPVSKLRIASVIGELQGKNAALAALPQASALDQEPESQADLATMRTIYTAGPGAVTTNQRDELVRNEGWFGKLALSSGQPDSDPLRHETLRRAMRTFVASATTEFIVAIAALAGLVLLIITLIRLAGGRIHRSYRPAAFRSSAFVECFALYLSGYLLIGFAVRLLVPHATLLANGLLIGWVPVAMLWPLFRGVTWPQLEGALGWYTGRGVIREAGAGLLAYLIGLPIVIAAGFLTLFLTIKFGQKTAHPIMFADTRTWWSVLEIYLLASVFAPLTEETMFRGALFNHLRQWHGWLISALVSSFIFAALHPQGWAAIPLLGSIGFVFAAIREWRGSFIASTTAHALNNGLVLTLMLVALR